MCGKDACMIINFSRTNARRTKRYNWFCDILDTWCILWKILTHWQQIAPWSVQHRICYTTHGMYLHTQTHIPCQDKHKWLWKTYRVNEHHPLPQEYPHAISLVLALQPNLGLPQHQLCPSKHWGGGSSSTVKAPLFTYRSSIAKKDAQYKPMVCNSICYGTTICILFGFNYSHGIITVQYRTTIEELVTLYLHETAKFKVWDIFWPDSVVLFPLEFPLLCWWSSSHYVSCFCLFPFLLLLPLLVLLLPCKCENLSVIIPLKTVHVHELVCKCTSTSQGMPLR